MVVSNNKLGSVEVLAFTEPVFLREQTGSAKVLGAEVRTGRSEVGYSHFQNQDVTGGGLEGVKKAHKEGVLEVLQDAKLMSDLVTLHQLLVHKLCGHCSLGSLLVTLLNYSKSTPVKPVTKKLHTGPRLRDGDLTPIHRSVFAGLCGKDVMPKQTLFCHSPLLTAAPFLMLGPGRAS